MPPNLTKTQQTTALFGAHLRALCAQKASASHVARELGINRQQFARYLNGTSIPRAGLIDQIAKYFDISVGQLFGSSASEPIAPLNIPLKDRSDFENLGTMFDTQISERDLPSGIHQGYKISQVLEGKCLVQLVRIYRSDGKTKAKRVMPVSIRDHLPMISGHRTRHGTFYKYQNQIIKFDIDPVSEDFSLTSYSQKSTYNKDLISGVQMLPSLGAALPAKAVLCCIKLSRPGTNVLKLAREQGVKDLSELPTEVQYHLGASQSGPYGKVTGIL